MLIEIIHKNNKGFYWTLFSCDWVGFVFFKTSTPVIVFGAIVLNRELHLDSAGLLRILVYCKYVGRVYVESWSPVLYFGSFPLNFELM